MVDKLSEFYRQFCLNHIETGLKNAVGCPPDSVRDTASYQQTVTDKAWNSLPLPVRMMTRERLRWDEFFMSLRKGVFHLVDGKVALRPEAAKIIHATITEFFGPANAATAPLAMPISPIASVKKKTEPAETTQEPSSTPSNEIAIGIDLGTTYSVVAHVDSHGRPYTINNGAGDLTTPSVILMDEGGPVVGKEAVMAATMEPERIASCVKRDMGARNYRRKVRNELFPPEVLSSIILRRLKEDAERRLGAVHKAVITVPAYFDEARRRATLDAGRMAGLDVLTIVNEPTAAAIAYGYQAGFLDKNARTIGGKPICVMVYDLGGGTFDVTIVRIEGSSFKALATDGDVALGGKDWDEKIIEIAADRIQAEIGEDPRNNPNTLEELWQAAETAKKTLTERQKATMYINHLGSRHKVEITREEFEDATSPLLGRTRTTCEIVVRQAGMKWSDIDQILMVGGSTRMPTIRSMLEEISGKAPQQTVSPDEAVAHGAALYADLLLKQQNQSERRADFSVTNINSHSLGLVGIDKATGRRKNQILIPKNTPLPHSVTGTFKTHRANQPNVMLRIVEGESERPEACTPIGTCKLDKLPPNIPAGWPIKVKYAYLADGQLRVSAQIKGQSEGISTVFQRENNMADNEISLWNYYLDAEGNG